MLINDVTCLFVNPKPFIIMVIIIDIIIMIMVFVMYVQ